MGGGVEPRTPQNLRCIPGRPFTPRFSRGVYPEAPVLGAEGFAFHPQEESAPPAPPPRCCPSRPNGGIIAQVNPPGKPKTKTAGPSALRSPGLGGSLRLRSGHAGQAGNPGRGCAI